MNEIKSKYHAILLVSFGGPEGPDDVMPFLRNVLRGRNVPEARMLEVAEHYNHFDGVSPINAQNRELIAALEAELKQHGIDVPIYFGNRNWHPMLEDTLRQMKEDGVEKAIAFFTSAFSCYSGCRQYRENIFNAQEAIGKGAPKIDKIRMCYNHPLFIEANSDNVKAAIANIPADELTQTKLLFTAHSIPMGMANSCAYQTQLTETSRLIAKSVGMENWELVYQSRSGPPNQPWLEPDVCDYIQSLAGKEIKNVVILPVGFLSDHMEVMFDLDTEAKEACDEHGLQLFRVPTVGVHPKFVTMIRELIEERALGKEKVAVGQYPPNHDVCPKDCCGSGRPNFTSPV